MWSVPHPLPAVPPSCRFVLGRGGRCQPLPSCIPLPWGGGGAWGGGLVIFPSSLSCHRHEVRHPSAGGGVRLVAPVVALSTLRPPSRWSPAGACTARVLFGHGPVVRSATAASPPCRVALGGGVACRLPLFRTPRPRGGGDGLGGGCALFVSPPLHARRRQDVGTTQSRGEALGCCGGGVYRLGLPALLHGLGPAAQDNQPLLPLGGSRHLSAWCSVSRACSLCAHTYWRRYVPGWKRKMRKCGQRGGLTVHLEGFLRHLPPWSRGGPLFRHPTARGGATAHPLPGACVSTSERPDTGAVVSVRWKWRLQSGRALSSPGPLPPPSAMEAPEVLWQRRGETDGGFICGIPWPPIYLVQHNLRRRGPTGWRRWCPSPLRHNYCNRRRGSSGWRHWRVSPLRHWLGHSTGGPTDGAAGARPPVSLPASCSRLDGRDVTRD